MYKIISIGLRIAEDTNRNKKYFTVCVRLLTPVLGCWRLSRKEFRNFQRVEILDVGLAYLEAERVLLCPLDFYFRSLS
jgi:hypothetical protein